jgi:hypothetical protein
MHVNWGDVPTWLAVVVAAVGGGIALRQPNRSPDSDVEPSEAQPRDDLLVARVNERDEHSISCGCSLRAAPTLSALPATPVQLPMPARRPKTVPTLPLLRHLCYPMDATLRMLIIALCE